MSLSQKVDLKLDWCSHAAAKYAVEYWHYSKRMPTGKNNYIGVWEKGLFIGSIIFGTGASSNLGTPYGLAWSECCELVRVALSQHENAISRIVAIGLRKLKEKNKSLRLCVSFADPFHQHIGAIYQAGNWIFTGKTVAGEMYKMPDGTLAHPRRFTGTGWNAPQPIPPNAIRLKTPGKYRYIFPLDPDMRQQIEALRKPYPKRTKDQAVPHQGTLGGETPTRPLHPLAPAG